MGSQRVGHDWGSELTELIIGMVLFIYFVFYWTIVDLQCCVTFRCKEKGFSYIYIGVYIYVCVCVCVCVYAAAAAKSHQSCPILCDPIDESPPGSSVPGILQARTVEWVAISFSNEWKWKVKVKSLSRVQLLATPWTVAYEAPLSMGFPRQEYWSGLPLPSPILYTGSLLRN